MGLTAGMKVSFICALTNKECTGTLIERVVGKYCVRWRIQLDGFRLMALIPENQLTAL